MPGTNLPPLAAIRCFEAAARHQSFTRAAEELGMTQAAVSYQIKLLEDRVGGALFVRGARGVTLTPAGRHLAPAAAEAFALLRAAFDDLRETAEGVLTISAVNTFASNWLVQRLGAFQIAHPRIAVRLEASSHLSDFTDVDVGIRAGAGVWPGLVADRLTTIEYAPMLSPRLIEQAGPLTGPADLLRLPLIDPGDPWWAAWFALAGVATPDLDRRTEMRLVTQQLAGAAAMAGHGVAILEPVFFADELATGRLVQPFPLLQNSGAAYWLVYPEARRRSAKIRAFRDWLLGAVAAPAAESAPAGR
jgi:LysR family transcriptional regulator, glycine cleavage system transcriptional activator